MQNDVVHVMPDSLLVEPCSAVAAGGTVRSLAKGYVHNTTCIGKYKLLLEKQGKYKQNIESIYGNPE